MDFVEDLNNKFTNLKFVNGHWDLERLDPDKWDGLSAFDKSRRLARAADAVEHQLLTVVSTLCEMVAALRIGGSFQFYGDLTPEPRVALAHQVCHESADRSTLALLEACAALRSMIVALNAEAERWRKDPVAWLQDGS